MGTQTGQDVLEGEFDIAGIKGRSLNEGEIVFTCAQVSAGSSCRINQDTYWRTVWLLRLGLP